MKLCYIYTNVERSLIKQQESFSCGTGDVLKKFQKNL